MFANPDVREQGLPRLPGRVWRCSASRRKERGPGARARGAAQGCRSGGPELGTAPKPQQSSLHVCLHIECDGAGGAHRAMKSGHPVPEKPGPRVRAALRGASPRGGSTTGSKMKSPCLGKRPRKKRKSFFPAFCSGAHLFTLQSPKNYGARPGGR